MDRGFWAVKYWLCTVAAVTFLLAGCQFGATTPAPTATPTRELATPTPTVMPTLSPTEQGLYPTYAHGELLPHMQVPVQRSKSGEGGWYVVIGSEEGWAQFLSQMGQPAGIWGPVQWEDEILVGVLLGVRQGRGHDVTLRKLDLDGVTAVAEVDLSTPTPEQAASTWVTYPFHFIRVPRSELALGPVTFRFERAWQTLAEQDVDMIDLDIVWLPGQAATYPTPTPIPTLPPEPTPLPTPVPNLRVAGTVLEVMTDTLSLRIVPFQSDWQIVELLEGTSIFQEGQPATLAELAPGTVVSVLGYPGANGPGQDRAMRAAHIDLLRPAAETGDFARYQPRSVSLSTIYDGYKLPLDARTISTTVSLTGTVPLTQAFSVTQTTVLTRNGFVVVPAGYPSFASLYNDPSTVTYPLYISADSVLQASRLCFGRVQRATERQHLRPELEMLDVEMYKLSWAQFEARQALATSREQRLANTALRNAAYFAVAASLLDPAFTVPEVLSPVVSAELSLIAAGQAITVSPLLDLPGVPDEEKLRVDYGQFVPHGYYAQDEDLARYYRAMTWHRAIAFRPDQREETRSAAAIAYTLQAHSTPRVLWQRIHAVLAFFQGRDASFTPPEYADLLAQVWDDAGALPGDTSAGARDPTALADEERMDVFIEGIAGLPLPDNPIWTIWAAKEPIERDWRFFSLPFRVEEYVFGQTTGDYVGSPGNERPLPSGIDLAAVLGSLEAYRVASEVGYTGYMNYVEQVDTVRNELSAIPIEYWTGEEHWNWLYVYRSLLQEKNASYPSWMNTTAWKRRTLHAKLGGWTQVYHSVGADLESISVAGSTGASPEETTTAPEPGVPAASWGYVEPQPEVYARLAALTRLIVDGLESRLMLPALERETLLELETWLMFLQDTARRELTTQALTDEEYTRLGEYGAFVDRLTQVAVADLGAMPDPTDSLVLGEGYSEAVAVPLVTAADTQLVEATGPVDEIYVVVERGRQPILARGGVYAQYEFPWPAADPMTDARWSVLLASGQGPDRPSWLAGVVIEE